MPGELLEMRAFNTRQSQKRVYQKDTSRTNMSSNNEKGGQQSKFGPPLPPSCILFTSEI